MSSSVCAFWTFCPISTSGIKNICIILDINNHKTNAGYGSNLNDIGAIMFHPNHTMVHRTIIKKNFIELTLSVIHIANFSFAPIWINTHQFIFFIIITHGESIVNLRTYLFHLGCRLYRFLYWGPLDWMWRGGYSDVTVVCSIYLIFYSHDNNCTDNQTDTNP